MMRLFTGSSSAASGRADRAFGHFRASGPSTMASGRCRAHAGAMEIAPDKVVSAGITELALDECWALLRTSEVGRLAVAISNHPNILPVNYVVDAGTVVFQTADGTKLAAAVLGTAVAFEIDGYDATSGEAWSVVLKGSAAEIDK